MTGETLTTAKLIKDIINAAEAVRVQMHRDSMK